MWRQKTGKDIPEDSFLYCAIKCTPSSYTMRYMIGERCGVIDEQNSDACGRIVFEGSE
jgi:hypothetical protein